MSVSPWFYLFLSYSVCFIYFLMLEIAGSAPLFHVSLYSCLQLQINPLSTLKPYVNWECLLIKVCIFSPIHELIWGCDKNELKQKYDFIALQRGKRIWSDSLKLQMEDLVKDWYQEIGESELIIFTLQISNVPFRDSLHYLLVFLIFYFPFSSFI